MGMDRKQGGFRGEAGGQWGLGRGESTLLQEDAEEEGEEEEAPLAQERAGLAWGEGGRGLSGGGPKLKGAQGGFSRPSPPPPLPLGWGCELTRADTIPLPNPAGLGLRKTPWGATTQCGGFSGRNDVLVLGSWLGIAA